MPESSSENSFLYHYCMVDLNILVGIISVHAVYSCNNIHGKYHFYPLNLCTYIFMKYQICRMRKHLRHTSDWSETMWQRLSQAPSVSFMRLYTMNWYLYPLQKKADNVLQCLQRCRRCWWVYESATVSIAM